MTREEKKELRITELECIADALKAEMYLIDEEVDAFTLAKDREYETVREAFDSAWKQIDKLNPPIDEDVTMASDLSFMDFIGRL